jgi:hypothetical protein
LTAARAAEIQKILLLIPFSRSAPQSFLLLYFCCDAYHFETTFVPVSNIRRCKPSSPQPGRLVKIPEA